MFTSVVRSCLTLTALVLLLELTGCTGSGDQTPVPTPASEASPSATAPTSRTPVVIEAPPQTPTPAPIPRAGLYLVNVKTEEWHTLIEPSDSRSGAYGWWEPDGNAVTAWSEVARAYTAHRFDLDGSTIEEHLNRHYITPSPDGQSRHYSVYEDGRWTRVVLEHNGVEVPVAADFGFAVGFSPAGDRLLVGRGDPAAPGRVNWTYWTIDVATGTVLVEFPGNASPEGTDGGFLPRWSPSGRYVATSGLDGLLVHDTTDGSTIRLGDGGSTEWAPAREQLVVETADQTLEIVTLPALERVPLATEGARHLGRFGAHGAVVAVRSYLDPDRLEDPIVTAYEASSGRQLGRWEGTMDRFDRQFVRFADGLVAIILGPADGCETFRIYSPLSEAGRCIDGHHPRFSPDGREVAYFRAIADSTAALVIYDVSTGEERTLGTPSVSGELPLARWNAHGTHLLVQRTWSGVGFTDELP